MNLSNPVEYFLTKYLTTYPSSNSTTGGKTNSEFNVRMITDKFVIRNFVVKRTTWTSEYDPDYSLGPLGFCVDPGHNNVLRLLHGECSIEGYYFKLWEDRLLEISLNDPMLPPSGKKKYHVVLQILRNGVGLLRGDGYPPTTSDTYIPDEDVVISYGLVVKFLEEIPDKDGYLDLGTFTVDEHGNIGDIEINKDKYSYIDMSTITDSDTGMSLPEWLMWMLNKLDTLQYFSDPEKAKDPNATPNSDFSCKDEDGKPSLKYHHYTEGGIVDREVDILDIDDRTHPSESGGTTPSGTKGNKTDTNNGTSDKLARADHDHDNRYILNDDAWSEDVLQKIGTNLRLLRALEVMEEAIFKSKVKLTRLNDEVITLDPSNGLIKTNGDISAGQNITAAGDITATGDIRAHRVYNAVWNDVAELFLRDSLEEEINPGDVIIKLPGKGSYSKSVPGLSRLVVGVCSDSYGYLLGGDPDKTSWDNLKKYIPVGIAGRVKVNLESDSIICEGDLLCPSEKEHGKAALFEETRARGAIIGKALENSNGKSQILMMIMLG